MLIFRANTKSKSEDLPIKLYFTSFILSKKFSSSSQLRRVGLLFSCKPKFCIGISKDLAKLKVHELNL